MPWRFSEIYILITKWYTILPQAWSWHYWSDFQGSSHISIGSQQAALALDFIKCNYLNSLFKNLRSGNIGIFFFLKGAKLWFRLSVVELDVENWLTWLGFLWRFMTKNFEFCILTKIFLKVWLAGLSKKHFQ